jgi:hypothetical protein
MVREKQHRRHIVLVFALAICFLVANAQLALSPAKSHPDPVSPSDDAGVVRVTA